MMIISGFQKLCEATSRITGLNHLSRYNDSVILSYKLLETALTLSFFTNNFDRRFVECFATAIF